MSGGKSFFAGKNIDLEIRDIAEPEYRRELVEKYKSRGVPTFVIEGEVIVVFDYSSALFSNSLLTGASPGTTKISRIWSSGLRCCC